MSSFGDIDTEPSQSVSKLGVASLRTGISVRNHVDLDTSIFTFKPKVSQVSSKIVETLGTDFMGRQLQHLENQRRTLSRSMSPLNFAKDPTETKRRPKKKLSRTISPDVINSLPRENKRTPTKKSTIKHDMESTIKHDMESTIKHDMESGGESISAVSGTDDAGRVNNDDSQYGTSDYDMKAGASADPVMATVDEIDLSVSQTTLAGDGIKPQLLAETHRSQTLPVAIYQPRLNRKMSFLTGDRLYQAKLVTEKAVKMNKIFTIQGGYHAVRQSLRRRGWVEKFFVKPNKSQRQVKVKRMKVDDDDDDNNDVSDDGDDDDDDDVPDYKNAAPKVQPWDEEDGLYGIMSRMIKYATPMFFWVLKRDVIDFRHLSKEQIVNHYCRAGSFTTKIGLCVNMRNVPWYEDADPNTFFPRCYRICNDADKEAFIDDFRLTACTAVLHFAQKMAAEQKRNAENEEVNNASKKCISEATKSTQEDKESKTSEQTTGKRTEFPATAQKSISPRSAMSARGGARSRRVKRTVVSMDTLHMSIQQIQRYIDFRQHDDIDTFDDPYLLNESDWNKLISSYYQLCSSGGYFEEISQEDVEKVETLLGQLECARPQFTMDGWRNVWILKPGAKSRGRGITCYNKLEDMLKLVNSQVAKSEGKYVVQKYIERPLLIYNTKFDIRQWFLVTDWNPLTIWFYQDCYLRFCSQQYTLESFDEAIHLSNNSIQKHYKNGPRSQHLPPENMWSHYEFITFLRERNIESKWQDLIYPQMKKAVTCALLATQDHVEYRKSSFELYGADFMLTEDYSPWLIEINSSPSMEKSTAVTAKLCEEVLDDTVKVVVDRKLDKTCDIGRFELAYKQPYVTVPPYVGLNISVDGQAIKKPLEERKVKLDPSKESIEDLKDVGDCKLSESTKDVVDCKDLEDADSEKDELIPSLSLMKLNKKKPEKKSQKGVVDVKGDEVASKLEQKENIVPREFKGDGAIVDRSSTKICYVHRGDSKTDRRLPPVYDAGKKHSHQENLIKNNSISHDVKDRAKESEVVNSSVQKAMLISPSSSFYVKRTKRFISKTSVANSYPILQLPSTLPQDRLLIPNPTATWGCSAHRSRGNDKIPKTIIFPLPGKINDSKHRSNSQKYIRDVKRIEALNSLPLGPYNGFDFGKMVVPASSVASRLKYINVARRLSDACICPPPKKQTKRQKGIFIHPLSY